MFPPEEIAAARRRERERDDQLAAAYAQKILGHLQRDDQVSSATVLPSDPNTIGLELLDGTELFVSVEPA